MWAGCFNLQAVMQDATCPGSFDCAWVSAGMQHSFRPWRTNQTTGHSWRAARLHASTCLWAPPSPPPHAPESCPRYSGLSGPYQLESGVLTACFLVCFLVPLLCLVAAWWGVRDLPLVWSGGAAAGPSRCCDAPAPLACVRACWCRGGACRGQSPPSPHGHAQCESWGPCMFLRGSPHPRGNGQQSQRTRAHPGGSSGSRRTNPHRIREKGRTCKRRLCSQCKPPQLHPA